MAAGHQGLLVGRGHDLARFQRCEDGPQGNQSARSHNHKVHIGPRGDLLQSVRPAQQLGAGLSSLACSSRIWLWDPVARATTQ